MTHVNNGSHTSVLHLSNVSSIFNSNVTKHKLLAELSSYPFTGNLIFSWTFLALGPLVHH